MREEAQRLAELYQALADGKTLQIKEIVNGGTERWCDHESYCGGLVLIKNREKEFIRIKPEPKKQWCRVALFKGKDDYFTQSLGNLLHEKVWEAETGFVRWITDRIEYELPEGEV